MLPRALCLLSLVTALGCADDPGLVVTGELTVDVDGTTTGFNFPLRTNLVDDDLVDADGPTAGHCRIGTDESGAQVVSVGLLNPGPPPEGVGIQSFSVRIAGDGGEVSAQLGASSFAGTLGETGCSAATSVVVDTDRFVHLEVNCELAGPDSATASLVADLDYSGCGVEE